MALSVVLISSRFSLTAQNALVANLWSCLARRLSVIFLCDLQRIQLSNLCRVDRCKILPAEKFCKV